MGNVGLNVYSLNTTQSYENRIPLPCTYLSIILLIIPCCCERTLISLYITGIDESDGTV